MDTVRFKDVGRLFVCWWRSFQRNNWKSFSWKKKYFLYLSSGFFFSLLEMKKDRKFLSEKNVFFCFFLFCLILSFLFRHHCGMRLKPLEIVKQIFCCFLSYRSYRYCQSGGENANFFCFVLIKWIHWLFLQCLKSGIFIYPSIDLIYFENKNFLVVLVSCSIIFIFYPDLSPIFLAKSSSGMFCNEKILFCI